LIIDYGYAPRQMGSTFQALRAHAHVDPFEAPGEADLTCLVDFVTAAQVAQAQGARVMGIAGQGGWLMALGMAERAAALAKVAPDETEAAYHRLTAPDQMGVLFKVLGLAGREWPDGAGFAPPAPVS